MMTALIAITVLSLIGIFVIGVTDAIENYEPKEKDKFNSKYYK